MKTSRWLLVVCILFISPCWLIGEEESLWEFSAEANMYFLPDQTYLNPVVSADRRRLHLEARYNYEDLDTSSIFAGYNFHAGQVFQFALTPMLGGVFGNSNGIAPGFSFELNYKSWTISSEGEYFFSGGERESNFFYSWSELVYSPADWFWFGVAGQRTRAYKTDLDLQRGSRDWLRQRELYNIRLRHEY